MTTTSPEQRVPIFVFDQPRTCSQLFNKLFANHAQLEQVFHPFMGASVYGPERMQLSLRHDDDAERAQLEMAKNAKLNNETYSAAAQRLTGCIEGIQIKDKVPYIKDHAMCTFKQEIILRELRGKETPPMSNPTCMPDELFRSLRPVMLIRHPALIMPSYYRTQKSVFKHNVQDEDFVVFSSLKWTRIAFDAFRRLHHDDISSLPESSGTATSPIVIDAEDVVHNTEPTISALCKALDINPDGVQYTWPAIPRENWPQDPIMNGFMADLFKSTGVLRAGKPAEEHIDLDKEEPIWAEEFGKEKAAALRQRVEEEMPNYLLLKRFKLCA